MKRKAIIILIHFLAWIILSAFYLYSVESIIRWLFPGFHSIEIWVLFLVAGLLFIFLVTAVSLILWLLRKRPIH